MSKAAEVISVQALRDLVTALEKFSWGRRELLDDLERPIARRLEQLEDRCEAWQRELRQRQRRYDEFRDDEEDGDLGRLAFQVEEAEESLQQVERQLERVRDAAAYYQRCAATVAAGPDEAARAFMQGRIADLEKYLAVRLDTGVDAGPPLPGAEVLTNVVGALEQTVSAGVESVTEVALPSGLDWASLAGLIVGDKTRSKEERLEVFRRRFGFPSEDQKRAFQEILSNSKTDPVALARGLSNPALDERMAIAIPLALAEILRAHPEAAGIFSPLRTRGPGANDWIRRLNHSTPRNAAGAAYELLATRKLMHQSAGTLKIRATDQIAFGPKSQARYLPDDFKTREVLASLVDMAPKRWSKLKGNAEAIARRTVESDLHIGRPTEYSGFDEIFVDFKHTKSPSTRLDPAELLGVAVALATGEITEAHFVCNAGLSPKSQKRIEDVNAVLRRWECGAISGHQNFTW